MVLQNKFKARASARYNATRGGSEGGGRGRGQSGGAGRGYRGRGRGRGRGGGSAHGGREEGEDDDGEDDGEDEDEEEDGDPADAAFPTLQAATLAGPSRPAGGRAEVEKVPAKYARRKLESNAWRYKEDDADPDPDAEPEPEVDLSNLFARVAKLDSSKNAVISLGAPQPLDASADAETAEDIEADIDHSLAYLYERERARERARTGRAKEHEQRQQGLSGSNVIEVASMSAEDRKKMEEEAEEMKADKEKAEALRALKERFQGHAVGERVKTSNVRRLIPAQPSSSEGSSKDLGPKPAHLQPKRDRLPDHARSWASRKTEDTAAEDLRDDFFFDEVVASPSTREGSGETARLADVAQTGGSASVDRKPASTKTDTKDMEDFLDAMLG
ncbi:unnamed protein product [Tilletia laevis]|uniref:Uncharacterized protein n=3 Tax=Tilletia TaxID=13289 RepID=A0A8X7T0J4_9BASI|nr:hypothetical protein CF336_g255 [Tilletia laevis]KAE8205543.1 hypothetical protein CF328_g446 [Tilletia controversa]KAE8265476.1 hypothetical protein A4X03_0g238 [Tilletia caries]KAE8208735.1 hypothetical protein CF335_g200 [Tilletia laevis]KAE8256162.1 hypothetical protein A4X06_0g49 [Tilletia controversa]